MNWRRWLGFDPAGSTGGVVAHRLGAGGEIRVDADQLEERFTIMSPTMGFKAIERELAAYSPPDREEKPLSDKRKKQLHLDDYQPRDTAHKASMRLSYERTFPAPKPVAEETYWRLGRGPLDWVDYRNRHPMHLRVGLPVSPPMRDALADLVTFLGSIQRDLFERDLVAVEVGVEHEPAPQPDPAEQHGWHYVVKVLAVPEEVLEDEQRCFEESRAAMAEPKPA